VIGTHEVVAAAEDGSHVGGERERGLELGCTDLAGERPAATQVQIFAVERPCDLVGPADVLVAVPAGQ